MRFNSYNAYPPGGVYFYELDGESVQSKSRPEISAIVRQMFAKRGLPIPVDPFENVMDFMCRSLPDGFCSGPPSAPGIDVSVVKEKTRALFGSPVAAPVVIRERIHVCLGCKENSKATCPECSGLLDWILKGMGSRTKIPADNFAYVCRPALIFVSALATAEDPGVAPEGCPENCWRLHGN